MIKISSSIPIMNTLNSGLVSTDVCVPFLREGMVVRSGFHSIVTEFSAVSVNPLYSYVICFKQLQYIIVNNRIHSFEYFVVLLASGIWT